MYSGFHLIGLLLIRLTGNGLAVNHKRVHYHNCYDSCNNEPLSCMDAISRGAISRSAISRSPIK